VQEVLEPLIGRGFVIRHPRRPGQKEDRYEQVLGGDDAVELIPDPRLEASAEPAEARSFFPPEGAGKDDRVPSVADEAARLDRLEAELLDLKGEIARLREALGD
jgi:uncharacterized protein YceH (UPF0502 family)